MKFIKKTLGIIAVLLLVCSCSSSGFKHYNAYTIYPIGYLLDRIGGSKVESVPIGTSEIVQTSNIVDNYQEILNDSLVLFHIGNLEPYLDMYEDEFKQMGIDMHAGDLSVLNLSYEYKRYTPVYVDSKASFVESDFYEGDIFNQIDTYDLDPFIWLSPGGMYSMANDVYKYLASNYVEQSEYFKDRFESLGDELINLEASYQNLFSKLVKENKTIKFVSMTASFSPWQKNFGIQIYPVCLSKYGALPSSSELEIIKNKIINDNVQYIAYESNMPSEMASLFTSLEEELGLKRVSLYNISSLTQNQIESGKDYLSLMYENLSILENMATPLVESVVVNEEEE